MNENFNVQIFNSPEFGEIRTAGTSEEPLFCAKDVATALGYIDTSDAIARHCKSSKKVFHPHKNGIGGVSVLYINERDVYRLIMRSNLQNAERFQDWVCDEILPSIRKTGGYIAAKEDDSPEELMAKALLVAQNTIARKEERLKQLKEDNERQQHVIEQKEEEINEMKPHAEYAKQILTSPSTVKVTQIAQDYGMSAQKFNSILSEYGVQYKMGNQWILKSKYKDKGYVHSKSFSIHSEGKPDKVMMNTEWTQKGRLFLYELLKREGVVPMIEKGLFC